MAAIYYRMKFGAKSIFLLHTLQNHCFFAPLFSGNGGFSSVG
jgi:hypothetical protein